MSTITKRVIQALNGDKVDRPPFICPGGMLNMVTTELMKKTDIYWPDAHMDEKSLAKLAIEVHKLTGIENLGVPFCMTVEAEAMGARVYMGTTDTEPRVIEYPLTQIIEWPKLQAIRQDRGRIGLVGDAVTRLSVSNIDAPVIANIIGPISLATSLIEPMIFFRALGKQPQQAHAFLSFLTDNLISYGRTLLQAGAQILTISDPSGTGDILGPRRFADFALPYINRILEELEGEYQACIVHICGGLHTILNEINQLKAQGISIDSNTSITAIHAALDNKVVVGNVSTHLLQNGDPDRVKAASLSCLRNGAAVLSPACGISTSTPVANLQAMAAAVSEYLPQG